MQRIAWLIEMAVVAGVLAGGLYLWARRQPGPARRAVVLRQAGFYVTAGLAFFFGAMLAGETFTDPGGWTAAGLVAAWAVPLAGLAALSWFRPGWAVYVLAALSATVIGVSVWIAVSPQAWRAFEDRHGPVQAVITFVVVAAIAVLGLKRTFAAGILMVAVGVIPVVVSSLGGLAGAAPLAVASTAPVITGVLYLVSAHLAKRPPPPARASTAQPERPKAA
ncbi:MAG: hypothetical protein ACYCVZ_01805 [Streptosporangiaceae bacterium]